MRYGNSESDSGAHGFLALPQRCQNGVAIRWFNFAEANKQIDQFNNSRPTLRCFHLGNDLLGRKSIGEGHADAPCGRPSLAAGHALTSAFSDAWALVLFPNLVI